jgi:hypothetical protein
VTSRGRPSEDDAKGMQANIGNIGDEDATLARRPSSGFSGNKFKRGSIYFIATLTNSSGAT